MSVTKNSLLIVLVAALTASGFAYFRGPQNQTAPVKAETAYERVIRTRTLRCGYMLWPTFEDMDPVTKQMKGLVPEFTEALGQKLGLKIEWVEEVIWGSGYEALKTGRIDAICSTDGMWSYASTAVVDYAEPMAYFPIYLFGRKGENRFKTFADMNKPDVTFSSIDGDISESVPVDRFPQAHRLQLPGSADPALTVVNVMDGKADLLITDALTVDRVNGTHENKLVKLREEPLAVINSSFSVAKGQEDLLRMLNQGFELLQQIGISDQILDKYDPEHKLLYRPAIRWKENIREAKGG